MLLFKSIIMVNNDSAPCVGDVIVGDFELNTHNCGYIFQKSYF